MTALYAPPALVLGHVRPLPFRVAQHGRVTSWRPARSERRQISCRCATRSSSNGYSRIGVTAWDFRTSQYQAPRADRFTASAEARDHSERSQQTMITSVTALPTESAIAARLIRAASASRRAEGEVLRRRRRARLAARSSWKAALCVCSGVVRVLVVAGLHLRQGTVEAHGAARPRRTLCRSEAR
jgi:hypothetical protein